MIPLIIRTFVSNFKTTSYIFSWLLNHFGKESSSFLRHISEINDFPWVELFLGILNLLSPKVLNLDITFLLHSMNPEIVNLNILFMLKFKWSDDPPFSVKKTYGRQLEILISSDSKETLCRILYLTCQIYLYIYFQVFYFPQVPIGYIGAWPKCLSCFERIIICNSSMARTMY